MSPSDEAAAPLMRIVRGRPTEAELVALVTGLLLLQGGDAPPARPPAPHTMWTITPTISNLPRHWSHTSTQLPFFTSPWNGTQFGVLANASIFVS